MATIEKMTVHKALAELKLLDGRIEKEIDGARFCEANKHSNDKIGGVTVAEYEKKIQGCYDKISDLINRRNALKRAVTLSNATSKVEIDGKEYTRAEAIEMKNHGMSLYASLLGHMQSDYMQSMAKINIENGKDLEERADKYVTGLYGNRDGKTSSDEIKKTRETFIETNRYELIDPLNITDKMEALEKKINDFMAEVDSALSVSNALTEIEIEY